MNKKSLASKRHPSTTPLDEWPQGWLVMKCASLLDRPAFIMMHDHEKRACGLPSTIEEMRAFIADKREGSK